MQHLFLKSLHQKLLYEAWKLNCEYIVITVLNDDITIDSSLGWPHRYWRCDDRDGHFTFRYPMRRLP